MTPEQMAAKLKTIKADMLPAIQKAMSDVVITVEREAKNNCTPGKSPYYRAPLITGTLRRSINSVVETKGNEVKGIIGANTTYAADVHEGTSKMEPRPFLLDAIKTKQEETISTLKKAIDETLEKHKK